MGTNGTGPVLAAVRDWLDGLAGALAPRAPRPALVPVSVRPARRIPPDPGRRPAGIYRPLKG